MFKGGYENSICVFLMDDWRVEFLKSDLIFSGLKIVQPKSLRWYIQSDY